MEEILSEDYCSYELSKLLREKGFKCGATYSKGFVKDGDGFVGGLVRHEDKITHQFAMKWLRKKGLWGNRFDCEKAIKEYFGL